MFCIYVNHNTVYIISLNNMNNNRSISSTTVDTATVTIRFCCKTCRINVYDFLFIALTSVLYQYYIMCWCYLFQTYLSECRSILHLLWYWLWLLRHYIRKYREHWKNNNYINIYSVGWIPAEWIKNKDTKHKLPAETSNSNTFWLNS